MANANASKQREEQERRELIILKGLCLKKTNKDLIDYIASRKNEFPDIDMPTQALIALIADVYKTIINNYKG